MALLNLRTAALRGARSSVSPASAALLASRRQQFHTSPAQQAWKHDQDRNSLRPESAEYTLSGTDSELSQKDDAAWNPNLTDPDLEFASGTQKDKQKKQQPSSSSKSSESSIEKNARSDSSASSSPDHSKSSGAGSDTNPLEVSGANPSVSRHTSEKEERTGDHAKSQGSKESRKKGRVGVKPTKDTEFIGAGKQ
ncbi:hypothetical protein QBC35DRAFT_503387 [Podospora australis]|uniref:Uncharacterized protein n=1 Tax=Podospora australis TaxID=1536484 RepID=A0AAN6WPB7_9PEZI|nr:hypothetical protein QBC35DRAFT_503387 [Podospora australis]